VKPFGRSVFGWIGGIAAAVIVVASIVVRGGGAPDPLADVAEQRRDVTAFHDLVVDQRWDAVYRAMSEPPAKDASSFRELMAEEVRGNGRITAIEIDGMRLLRSRAVPLLEVNETVTTTDGRERTISYYARRDDRWVFAFSSSPRDS
jgi:hypothetical protein